MKLFTAVSVLALQNVLGGNIKQDMRMEQAAEANTANVFNVSAQGLPVDAIDSDVKESVEGSGFKWGSKLHHSSSSGSEDMSMSMSMSMDSDIHRPIHKHKTSPPTMAPTTPPDYSLGKADYGRCHQLPTTDKEKCALYQTGYAFSEFVAKEFTYLGPYGQPNQPAMKTSSGEVGKGGKLLEKFLEGLDEVNTKKEKMKKKDVIGEKGIVLHPGLPTISQAFPSISELCEQTCGILEMCPDNCEDISEIEAFCDFAIPEPYKEAEKRKMTDSQSWGNEIMFSPECGFCVDTCRSDCIAFVSGCCPCAAAKTVVEVSNKDYNYNPSVISAIEFTNFLGDVAEAPIWGYGTNPVPVDFPHTFFYNVVTNAKNNLGVFSTNSKDGFGILFDNQIGHTKPVMASRLDIVYQTSNQLIIDWVSTPLPFSPFRGFFTPYDRDPLAWLYNENKTLSEDHVHFKGKEDDWGIVSGENAQARLVFRDSTGWHITKDSYALNQFKSIRMTDPNMKYHHFDPISSCIEKGKVEAGRTLGPSAPSFNCIDAIGIQIVATAKKHFCIRRREDEVTAIKEDEQEGAIIVQDEVVDAQDEEVDAAFINCKGEYYARWTNLAAEAKTWSGYD